MFQLGRLIYCWIRVAGCAQLGGAASSGVTRATGLDGSSELSVVMGLAGVVLCRCGVLRRELVKLW